MNIFTRFWLTFLLVGVLGSNSSNADGSRPNCPPGLLKGESVIVCEHTKLILQCEDDKKTIKIARADYGRTEPGSKICPHKEIRTTNCSSADSTQRAAEICDGNQSCLLDASNSVFGDPCWMTFKYLKVQFCCH